MGSVNEAGRGWGHTHADTLDPRDLRELPHASREEARERVADHTRTELSFFDRWPPE